LKLRRQEEINDFVKILRFQWIFCILLFFVYFVQWIYVALLADHMLLFGDLGSSEWMCKWIKNSIYSILFHNFIWSFYWTPFNWETANTFYDLDRWHIHLTVNPAWVSSFLRERIFFSVNIFIYMLGNICSSCTYLTSVTCQNKYLKKKQK
jgi:hypothetical protein